MSFFQLPPLLSLSSADARWYQQLCQLIAHEISLRHPTSVAVVSSLFSALLLKLMQTAQVSPLPWSREAETAFYFKQLVFTHFQKHRDLPFYAKNLSVTEDYLYRCVKKICGRAPKEIILETLMTQAKILLQNSSQDITQIAYELQLDSPSYFGRLFKKMTGYTPSAYRQITRQDSYQN